MNEENFACNRRLIGYCAGALTGTPTESASLYSRLRDALQPYNVGLYLPMEHTGPGTRNSHPLNSSPEDVTKLDLFRVGFSDFMLCCLDRPSTGTGMEIMHAGIALVPLFAFYRDGLQLEVDVSRMPVGAPQLLRFGTSGSLINNLSTTKVFIYKQIDDLVESLRVQIEATKERMNEARLIKAKLDRAWKELALSTTLRQRMADSLLTEADVALSLGTSCEVVRFLKMSQNEFEEMFDKEMNNLIKRGHGSLVIDPSGVSVLRYLNPSIVQLGSLSAILDINLLAIVGNCLTREFDFVEGGEGFSSEVPMALIESHRRLLEVGNGADGAMKEYLWHQELGKYKLQLLNRRSAASFPIVTKEEWEMRLRSLENEIAKSKQQNLF